MGKATPRKSGDLPSLLNHTGTGCPGRRLNGDCLGASCTRTLPCKIQGQLGIIGRIAFESRSLERAKGMRRVSGSPILAVDGVEYVAQANKQLLHPVSFTLDKGSILAIAGPNGAGKSTLLNLLSGLEPLATGKVILEGKDFGSMSAAERAKRIAVVSQHGNPDGRLKLRDYVALGQMPIWSDRSEPEHAAHLDQVLNFTRLTDLAESPMAHLSGGERQRAHIARAFAQRPHLLFLDEPTNHLDPDAKGRMLSLIASLGVTVVMIVHDLVMIPEFATHVALMKAARLTHFGPVADVLTPANVQDTFGVEYLEFSHDGRVIAALDIRKTELEAPTQQEKLT